MGSKMFLRREPKGFRIHEILKQISRSEENCAQDKFEVCETHTSDQNARNDQQSLI